MIVCVGIDPSFNSTGICLQYYNDDNIKIKENFILIKPNKLTKKEIQIDSKSIDFEYVLYQKINIAEYKDNNIDYEYYKTINIINLANTIKDVIKEYCKNPEIQEIYIVIEGISYGSTLRTKSIFDLAGLNYIIRNKFINIYDDENRIKLNIVPPTHIKKFATGKGNANKDRIINIFSVSHPKLVSEIGKIDDLADAYYMCCYAKELYKEKR